MLKICKGGKCAACGACMNICKYGCISYAYNKYGEAEAVMNTEHCTHCGMCIRACPINNPPEGNPSKECFAAWSIDKDVRLRSASGGIATEFYRYAAANNIWFVGVSMSENCNAVYSMEKTDWKKFRNSKYTFSDTQKIYLDISKKLKSKEKVLFIGLPCQVAGLHSYLLACEIEETDLVTVDLICHGIMPPNYLKEHVEKIERKSGKKAAEIYFRDPDAFAYTYTFSLKDSVDGRTFYRKKVNRNDTYQIGYHRGIGYRSNCYECKFANENRQGDLTLSDFAGVGIVDQCWYDKRDVSCILVNTLKGENFLWGGGKERKADIYGKTSIGRSISL